MALVRSTRSLVCSSLRFAPAFSTEAAVASASSSSSGSTVELAHAAYKTLDDLPFPTLVKSKRKAKLAPVSIQDGISRIKAAPHVKFDETVELSLNLGIDPRRGDQMVRGATELPHGTGRSVRVAVFATGEDAVAAQEAGADVVGADDLIGSIAAGGALDFDKAVATPSMMPKVGKVARILGPRGLMPNPKLGTVSTNVAEAVAALKRGKAEYRADKGGVIHAGLGKVSFSDAALQANIAAFMAAIVAARPKGLKGGIGGYLKSASLSCTMGPGVPVTVASLLQAAAAAKL